MGNRVLVIGGGISGLSAAYDLTRAGADCTILEKQSRVGGVIETRVSEGCTLECGPDSFLSAKPAALALIKEVGLEGDVIGSNDHQRTTYIWKRGALVALPEGVMMIVPSRVMPMVKTSLLGWGTKIRMGLEYFRQAGRVAGSQRGGVCGGSLWAGDAGLFGGAAAVGSLWGRSGAVECGERAAAVFGDGEEVRESGAGGVGGASEESAAVVGRCSGR